MGLFFKKIPKTAFAGAEVGLAAGFVAASSDRPTFRVPPVNRVSV